MNTTSIIEALTPSAETKAAYSGEFSFTVPDKTGAERGRKVNVPWQAIKQIMARIAERAGVEKMRESTGHLHAVLDFEPMKGLGGGFRTEWATGTQGPVTVGLESGAGLGNPLLTFWVEGPGKGAERHYYTADIRPLMQTLADQVLPQINAGEPKP